MISLLKHVYNLFDIDYQKEQNAKKFEEETQHFDDELNKEEPIVEDIVDAATLKADKEEISCIRKTGVITSLRNNNGIIDNSLFFDSGAAVSFHDMKIGNTVDYLAYKSTMTDFVKLVKVELTQDGFWDDAPSEAKIQETIESLKLNDPKYFHTHQRSILGLIVSRNRQFVTVDTEYKEITVDLDSVTIEFIPKEGDRVYLECNVQTDDNFVDQAGEILETIRVHPARTKTEQGTVKKLHEDWGVIDLDCYFTMDILNAGENLNEGDEVSANMIECERGNFFWRCLSINVVSRDAVSPQKPAAAVPVTPTINNTSQRISITEEIQFNLQNAFDTQQLDIEIENHSERVYKLLRVDFVGIRRNSQLKLDGADFPITVEARKTMKIPLVCESRFYGHTKEKIYFSFGNFKIYRHVNIAVGVDPEDKENIEIKGSSKNRSRRYANQVWSRKNEVIPGVRTISTRRFVANKIGVFEVPERLRAALLNQSSRADQISNVDALCPALLDELNFLNYSKRFQTLLHIEEIEHFVNFRLYDQERGHFTREGEFLALTIDNLAEKRPSLVMGDTVRATNPWAEEEDNRAYDGCIHKVLFNRILVKFNPAFQNKYNGEDYRLEFYFSRYSFRKQHYAIQNITHNRGENFLFPSKIKLSEKLQSNVSLDDDANLVLDGKILPKQWCNPSLNIIQKNAIKNILRGEARSMPYVIFGPPGTGKTITVVELILQIVRNLPNSRILIGAPSNSSADLIASRLVESEVLKPGDFVRLVSQRAVEKELIPDHLKQYCATLDIGVEGSSKDTMTVTESGMKLHCQMKYLGRHKITISTCATLGNFLQLDFPKGHFTHLIIDESGQCTEPELMLPICLLSPNMGQVVLAGDPQQLGPIVVNNYATDRGLGVSFLERVIVRLPYKKDKIRFPESGCDPRLVTKLTYNYRALPSILHSYSSLFYDSELVPMLANDGNKEFEILNRVRSLLAASEKRPAAHAAFFHGIRGMNKQDADSPSWYNPIEAKQIFLMTIQLYRFNVSSNQIGIITPYQKQVKILRTLFAEADVTMPKIGSVEEFQGQERDIILVSTVRSSKNCLKIDLKYALGFACSPKRMNVAISRARALLYVCGNPHLLAMSEKWCDFIKYCVDNDAYVGCDLPQEVLPK